MNSIQLNKVISLIRRTGDKFVIMDNESDSVFMLMDLDHYERMLQDGRGVSGLSEGEMLEKINRDIAQWRSSNINNEDELYGADVDFGDRYNDKMINDSEVLDEGGDNYYDEEDYYREEEEQEEANKKKNKWEIPAERIKTSSVAVPGFVEDEFESEEVNFEDSQPWKPNLSGFEEESLADVPEFDSVRDNPEAQSADKPDDEKEETFYLEPII